MIYLKRKKKREKKRKYAERTPYPNSYLIITEGKKTEPLYFKGLIYEIKQRHGGNINVEEIPRIKVMGEGRCTVSLVEKAEEIVNKSKIIYENVWLVFDKDDFQDFDKAIKLAEEKGFKVAWSNECFEYWIYLHFNYTDAALHREEWYEKLTVIFNERGINGGKYEKNYKDIFVAVSKEDGLDRAIANAQKIMKEYDGTSIPPQKCNPGTMVHKLVEELKIYLTN